MVAVIGKKIGMSRIYQENGTVVPVTLIEIYDSLVSDVNTEKSDNFKRLSKSVLGYYKKKNLDPYDNMKTFKTDKEEEIAIGSIIGIDQFSEGVEINVTGISKGKGFAGVIKRFNFRGEPASHGVSLTHRHQGGTGWRRREGRVIKGKKMPGHMGNEQVTVKNLSVVKVIPEDKIICVKGAIPGGKGGKIIINKSK